MANQASGAQGLQKLDTELQIKPIQAVGHKLSNLNRLVHIRA
jgi:hypothetical protein